MDTIIKKFENAERFKTLFRFPPPVTVKSLKDIRGRNISTTFTKL